MIGPNAGESEHSVARAPPSVRSATSEADSELQLQTGCGSTTPRNKPEERGARSRGAHGRVRAGSPQLHCCTYVDQRGRHGRAAGLSSDARCGGESHHCCRLLASAVDAWNGVHSSSHRSCHAWGACFVSPLQTPGKVEHPLGYILAI